MQMGLREANQHFSKAIKAVKAGREVVLTERGVPVAVIRPVRPAARPLGAADRAEAALQRMAAEGRARLATIPGPMPLRRWKPIRIKGSLSAALRADRDARWRWDARVRGYQRPREIVFWTLLEVDGRVLERAEAELTRGAPLRTLDALHIATALTFQADAGVRVPFITGDDQQRRAGLALSLEVVFVG
jgi:prevent-host-death family protein